MLIKKISLENFRSYPKKEFEFKEGVNLVVGPNTAGKSNLLEAVFLIAFGKSPRADLDREMVRGEEKLGFVRAIVTGSDDRDLEVVLTETGKRFRVNGVARRLADFSQHFHVVLFSPEDLNLVTGNPDLRRRFIDFALGSVDPRYARASTEFDQVRKRRNQLLEQINKGFASEEELGFWDAKFLEHGVLLQDKRKEFFDEINQELGTEEMELGYQPSGLTAERLLEYRPREIAAETSLIGPHRDDFEFFGVNQSDNQPVNLSSFGSRGEQRRAVLALKEAELRFAEKKIENRPVLLLDDIFSELDEENRARVFDLIGDGQTIITTTDLNHIPVSLQKGLSVIRL
ncbi:MAG TPA: DNA replication and repair protein RecF [Patescibacteria group bacterium]|nr:DNA replication and repair protein RecF [Patescibacteria group bacterium]